jgi:hypothetical protein
MIALSDAKLQLGAARQVKRGLSVEPCEPVMIRLAPEGTFPLEVPWAPSGFEGGERKSVTFVVSPELGLEFEKLEASVSGGDPKWMSRLKTGKTGETLIRVKFAEDCEVYDEAGEPTTLPEPWRKHAANAVVTVKGVYASTLGRGLLAECTHLQLKPTEERPKVNPFAQRGP